MKILIIKLAAIGDVLRTTCILLPLKKKYPGARISWVTEKNAKELLLHNPHLDACYSLEEFKKLGRPTYDLVISLDEDERAARLASNTEGKAVGFYFEKGKVLPTETAKKWFSMSALGKKPQNDILKKKNRQTYQGHMMNIAGLPYKGQPIAARPLIYTITDKEKRLTARFKKRAGISPGDIVIGVNTGAGGRWQYKKWPLEKTCELILRLSGLPNVKLVLFGGPEEKLRNKEIVRRVGGKIIDAGANNPLRLFAALINACDILLSSDSLSMHIGIALRKYVVAFFGPTSLAEIELYGNGKKIAAAMDCLACYKQKCDFRPSCMDAISVDAVFRALYRSVGLLKKVRKPVCL